MLLIAWILSTQRISRWVVSDDHDDLVARGPRGWFTQVNYPVGPVRYYGLGSDFIYTKNLQGVVSYDHDDLIARPPPEIFYTLFSFFFRAKRGKHFLHIISLYLSARSAETFFLHPIFLHFSARSVENVF